MDKITAIVCNYNHEDYLFDSLVSLINQDYENLEIILIDDASKVYPLHIIDQVSRMGRKIEAFQMKENRGKWFCLNHAILKRLDTKWFMVHDADDIAYPWKASLQLRETKMSGSLLNLAGYDELDGIPFAPDLAKVESITHPITAQAALDSIECKNTWHYNTHPFKLHNGAILFHRKIFDYGIRFNPPQQFLRVALSEDSDFNIRATLAFRKTCWTPVVCYGYRQGTSTNQESF